MTQTEAFYENVKLSRIFWTALLLPHLVSVEDLADAAVADAQLPGDDAGADAGGGHLDDLEADVVGQRAAVDEHAAELVHAALPCLYGRQVSYLCQLTLLVRLAY